ncbi:GGDEF domain-containing protein [Candidatus Reidiella endopervernicosa]|uniref:GGDEF domain-containing protein n=1 Tax=Candidatus Reidiella endopervernicosa TaxID=2738883 RepID=A0A6N0HSB6_9GAMM|nr:GGDEF domain-containing protein [Candidatus Reidiella endopervernicosa]QKQ25224.1 GGDEF domain-containing protein [Candidatus Reidiella endopervernicosa]
MAISGLHWLDYPLLRPIESFAPIGFSLCAIISVAINSLLAGMLLRQFRHRMLEAEEMAVDSATHDLLTGLNNRMALNTLFDQVMAQARRNETEIAMLYLDLDGFKPVNDRLGHRAGDEVLIEVAKRITSVARESDVVARIGGDEFVVILTGLKGGERADAEPIAEKIVDVINLPMNIAGEGCRLSTSVGIAYCPSQARASTNCSTSPTRRVCHQTWWQERVHHRRIGLKE